MTRRVVVDTAALALHLGCTPAHVRRMARQGFITPIYQAMTGTTGRPAMHFDIDAVDAQLAARRTELDQAPAQVRK